MADDLINKMEKFHLTENENEVISNDDNDTDRLESSNKISLIHETDSSTNMEIERGRCCSNGGTKPLCFPEVDGNDRVSEVTFKYSPCWIRVYNSPLAKRNLHFAKKVGDNMGGFVEFDDTDPLGGVKIEISPNITKWVDIKYERIGDFCYFCGKLVYVDRDCEAIHEEEARQRR
ncbi:Bud site selection protein RAX2 [Bienertia sinuspersici]